MENTIPTGQFCQSCSMPLLNKDDFGTNSDGSVNNEYCNFCCQNGNFTQPNITMEQMIEQVAGFMRKMNMTEQMVAISKLNIPTLKRWKV